MSRREFLRNAASVAAVGATGMSMAGAIGCTPQDQGVSVGGTGGGAAGGAAGGGMGGLIEATPSEQAKQYGNSRFAFRSDWLGDAPKVADSEIKETLETEIVVVGAGHAGSACIRRAAEQKAKVIGVEAQAEDAFSAFGSDIGHLNSKWQKSQGIPEADTTDFIEVVQLLSANRTQPDLLRKYATRSGETFDWLMESLNDEQKDAIKVCNWPVATGYTYAKGPMRAYPGTAKMEMQSTVVNTSILLKGQQANAVAAGAQMLYGHRGEYVEVEGGRAVAVIVFDEDGSYKRIKASKAVVLAAGDYAGNPEMFTTLVQEAAELNPGVALTGMGRDGSGVKMGLWAGGKMEPGTRAAMGGNVFSPGGLSGALLWLNGAGERFCNEGWGHPFIAGVQGVRQTFGPMYSVWDSNWRAMMQSQMTGHGNAMYFDDAYLDTLEPNLQNALAAGSAGTEGGTKMFAAQTLEELASYLGVDVATFTASVQRYNSMCKAGKDSDYAKAPELLFSIEQAPFYASVGNHEPPGGRILVTLGGLFVDGSHRVIGDDFNVIPGLYAAGNNSGGRFPLQYTAPVHGMSLGMANTLGYVLGEELAAL
jgi:succinate dehydrogenase/fumarate reductase flavoprotein subunit